MTALATNQDRGVRTPAAAALAVGALLVGAVLGALLGTGDGTQPAAAPPDDAVAVTGTADCRRTSSERDFDGVREVIENHYTCDHTSSDERVTGTEELVVTSRVDDRSVGGVWVATGTITTPGGTWEGSGQGAFSTTGNLPGTTAGFAPVHYGEMRYEGDGGHDGLTYHYYFAGPNVAAGVNGWIEP